MEWLAVIPIIIVAAWALGSPNEATREWRAKARYMRWESTAQRWQILTSKQSPIERGRLPPMTF